METLLISTRARSIQETTTFRARILFKVGAICAQNLHESCKKQASIVHSNQHEGSSKVALREQQIGPRGKCCFAAHQLQRQATHYVFTQVNLLKPQPLALLRSRM
jgi:hypothetical protein